MRTDARIAPLLLAGMLWLSGCQQTVEKPTAPNPKAPPPPPTNSQQVIADERARVTFEVEAAKADMALKKARELGVGQDELDVMPILIQAASAAQGGDFASATRLVQEAQAQAEAAADRARARKPLSK